MWSSTLVSAPRGRRRLLRSGGLLMLLLLLRRRRLVRLHSERLQVVHVALEARLAGAGGSGLLLLLQLLQLLLLQAGVLRSQKRGLLRRLELRLLAQLRVHLRAPGEACGRRWARHIDTRRHMGAGGRTCAGAFSAATRALAQRIAIVLPLPVGACGRRGAAKGASWI